MLLTGDACPRAAGSASRRPWAALGSCQPFRTSAPGRQLDRHQMPLSKAFGRQPRLGGQGLVSCSGGTVHHPAPARPLTLPLWCGGGRPPALQTVPPRGSCMPPTPAWLTTGEQYVQGTSQQELPQCSIAPTSPHPQTSGAPRSPSVSGSTRDVADREGQGRAGENTGSVSGAETRG